MSYDRYNSGVTHQALNKSERVPHSSQSARRQLAVLASDLLVVLGAYVLAFLLRFDFILDGNYALLMVKTAPWALIVFACTSFYFGVNRGLRHYASFGDIVNLVKAAAAAAVIQGAIILFMTSGRFPRSVLLLAPGLTVVGVTTLHAAIRYFKAYYHGSRERRLRTAVIVGAGDMGELVYRQMRTHETVEYRIIAFIDDDPMKWGLRLHGVPVVGDVSALAGVLRGRPVDEVVIAVASRRGFVVSAVAEAMKALASRPEIRVVPTVDEALGKKLTSAQPRKVQPSDLLNRKQVHLDAARIGRSIEGKVVLVTGAGGTIGGELSRQVAQYRPRKIILLENHATALFYRDAELKGKIPGVEVVGILGDVRDQSLLDRIFKEHKPHAVFHAAAHKHVHQLETNVHEGVSNNVIGTYNLACAADKHGSETFLLISTDKAVRPSCVMGATKRAAEVVVSDFARSSKTRFAAVRFGNVLGSSGSVLKIFQEQIEKGQPLTITHPDVTRYFMTVEEAVGLVLQASSMMKGSEIFVLNMGEPVRIMDMASNLILLSGLEPGRDVEIHISGLKPGEKLNEELVEDAAGQEKSDHPDIMVLRKENPPKDGLRQRVLDLELAARSADKRALLARLQEFVPTFTLDKVHGEPQALPEDEAEV